MGKAFSLARLLRGKVSIPHMGLSSSHVLFPMTWGVFPLASPGLVSHWKGLSLESLPMGRPSHGKAFSLARFLRGKVSIHHMALSSSHVLFPMTWGVFPLASPGLVSHWKGLSLERLPMGRPS